MYDLAALRQTTDAILEIINFNATSQFQEPINWADLHCMEAAHVQTDDGREYHRVLIEEAAPECPKLCAYIADQLAGHGYKDVEVVTEW